MTTQDFMTAFSTEQTPKEVFDAITNVRGWWSEEIEGGTSKLNDEFRYQYGDAHRCRMRLTEVVPDKKVVWHVLENQFNFTTDKNEWTGTNIIFDIFEKDNKTHVRFTHEGLAQYECFEICSDSWTNYIQKSLYNLITTGKGQPNSTGNPQTENERRLGAV